MNIVLGVVTVFVLVVFNVVNSIKVTVYYEALCPDSQYFIGRQLYPHYSKIADYIELDLVPYGKAIHTENNGTWKFSCQHGPAECRANKYQSCALSLKAGTETDVKFVNCIMWEQNTRDVRNVEFCAKKFDMDVAKIKACASSDEGDKLLAQNGDKTWSLEPNISFVPTIVYGDKFDQLSQDLSMTDFLAVVCSKLNGTKPADCNNRPLPKAKSRGFF